MQFRNCVGAIGAAMLLLGLAPCSLAASPQATPQRPSLSTSVWTVPRGMFELEAGAGFSKGSAALPLFGKYGLTDALELNVGIDAVRWVDGAGDGVTSVGDLLLGTRWRADAGSARVRWAIAGSVKLPLAEEEAGSGELDGTVAGIATIALDHDMSLDVNFVWSALGRDGGGWLGQAQAIASLGIPLGSGWSSFVEAAHQQTAGQGDGVFIDAGLAYTATPRAVFDIAAGSGWSQGYPDWSVSLGWTLLFSKTD